MGDMGTVASLLGRPYRLVCNVQLSDKTSCTSISANTFLNMPPAPGAYNASMAVLNVAQQSNLHQGSVGMVSNATKAVTMSFWEDEFTVNLPPSIQSDRMGLGSAGGQDHHVCFTSCSCVVTPDGIQVDDQIVSVMQNTAGPSYVVIDFMG